MNPVPVKVTKTPPVTGPELGLIETITGTPTYVYGRALLEPDGVVTVTCAVPAPGGATAVICVFDTTVNEVAGVAPKFTAVAPDRPEPVMVTEVPPAAGPPVGLSEVSEGT
nr:hypothetical protein [Nocardia pneumoniae]